MDLSDALDGDWPSGGKKSEGSNMWSDTNPTWPASGSGSGEGGVWPGGNPSHPAWPSQPSQPGGPGPAPAWPSGPAGPGPAPAWPSGPAGPGPAPAWPSAPAGPGPAPAWPSGPAGPAGPAPSQPNWPSQPGGHQRSLAVPYTHSLSSGVYNKLMIVINGVIKANPNMFTVDVYASDNIALHINPRFNDYGQKVIVSNSRIGGKWGAEERQLGHFPFSPGQAFEMKILCTNREFKVAVNGSHLLEFKHRIQDLNSIRSFGIHNDVTLTSVRTETLP